MTNRLRNKMKYRNLMDIEQVISVLETMKNVDDVYLFDMTDPEYSAYAYYLRDFEKSKKLIKFIESGNPMSIIEKEFGLSNLQANYLFGGMDIGCKGIDTVISRFKGFLLSHDYFVM